MSKISLKDLVAAGVHIGHIKSRWCPAMAPNIWGVKSGVHLIDVSKTAYQLEKAAEFLQSMATQGKPILWVGTKKPAQSTVQSHAIELSNPYVTHRWIGGTLTNFPQVKKSVTKLLHYEDVVNKVDEYLYTKKEINKFQKLADRLRKNVGGIRKLTWPIGVLVVVDVKKEQAAVREAIAAGIPIVGIVDTNSDPTGIDYVIPANDDAPRSIAFIIDFLAEAAKRGQTIAQSEKAKKEQEKKQAKDAEQSAQESVEEVSVEMEIDEEDESDENEKKSAKKAAAPLKKRAKTGGEDDEEEPKPKAKPKAKSLKKSEAPENPSKAKTTEKN